MHEAFFDPVHIDDAVGADGESGVLQPDRFETDEGETVMERVEWLDGRVEMELSPAADLTGHRMDFIALDGSVALRLDFDDAVTLADDEDAATFAWGVCDHPWADGDLLMLRIAEGVPDDGGAAMNDLECLVAMPERISAPAAVETPEPTPKTEPTAEPEPTAELTATPITDACLTGITSDGAACGSWSSSCATDRSLATPDAPVGTRYTSYYTFVLSQQSEVTITLESSEDTYLCLLSGHDRTAGVIEQNDDIDAQNYNSRVVATLANSCVINRRMYGTPELRQLHCPTVIQ